MEYAVIQIVRMNINDERSVTSYCPTYIDGRTVDCITPLLTKKGVPYKNVSIIETSYNKLYTVVGNYKHHKENILKRERMKIKGFKR